MARPDFIQNDLETILNKHRLFARSAMTEEVKTEGLIPLGGGFSCLMNISDQHFHRTANIKEIGVMPTYPER